MNSQSGFGCQESFFTLELQFQADLSPPAAGFFFKVGFNRGTCGEPISSGALILFLCVHFLTRQRRINDVAQVKNPGPEDQALISPQRGVVFR